MLLKIMIYISVLGDLLTEGYFNPPIIDHFIARLRHVVNASWLATGNAEPSGMLESELLAMTSIGLQLESRFRKDRSRSQNIELWSPYSADS